MAKFRNEPVTERRSAIISAAYFWELVAGVIGLGFVAAAGTSAIMLVVSRRFGLLQRAYEDAPQSHQAKTGTPTMGGFAFLVASLPLLVVGLYWHWRMPVASALLALFFLIAACSGVGFIDDYMAIRRGRNRGLRARTKYLATALIAVIFLRLITETDPFYINGTIFAAGHSVLQVPYWLWLVLGIFAITGTAHGVNLSDGLDGLAAGAFIPPLAVLAFVSLQNLMFPAMFGALLGIGACLGFLVYNHYPAKLIMGDTGSLALGALLSGVAILSGEMLLLIVIGGVFVAETLSVILQVAYFKLTHGKRIFKMSPLHHHFELSGWPETKVTTRFWIASALCSAVGLAIVR